MAADKDDDERESTMVSWVAGVTATAGLLLILAAALGLQSASIRAVDQLSRFEHMRYAEVADAGVWQVPVITTARLAIALLVIGVCAVLAALLGMLGAQTRHKHLVCCYVVVTVLLAIGMFAAALHMVERKAVVEPMLSNQVVDLCNATRYIRLGYNIPCDWAAEYAAYEVSACGDICQTRVGLFRKLDGCEVLPGLCKHFLYEEMSADECSDAVEDSGDSGAMYGATGDIEYGASLSLETCEAKCDEDIMCASYAYSEASEAKPQLCLLFAGLQSKHKAPEWAPVVPGGAAGFLEGAGSQRCFRRTTPRVLSRFGTQNLCLVLATFFLMVVLLVAATLSCCLMYNTNMKRPGLPSGRQLGLAMCCPCLARDNHRRFSDDSEASEDLSEDAEDELE